MSAIPSWISALASVGALLAAVVAGVTARRLYGIEREREHRLTEADERRQAVRVSAWVAEVVGPNAGERSPGVVVVNASQTAVRDVLVSVIEPDDRRRAALRLAILPPGEYFAAAQPPPYHWGFPNLLSALEYPARPVMRSRQWRVTEVTFRDAADRSWRRDDAGVLHTAARQDDKSAFR